MNQFFSLVKATAKDGKNIDIRYFLVIEGVSNHKRVSFSNIYEEFECDFSNASCTYSGTKIYLNEPEKEYYTIKNHDNVTKEVLEAKKNNAYYYNLYQKRVVEEKRQEAEAELKKKAEAEKTEAEKEKQRMIDMEKMKPFMEELRTKAEARKAKYFAEVKAIASVLMKKVNHDSKAVLLFKKPTDIKKSYWSEIQNQAWLLIEKQKTVLIPVKKGA